MDSLVGSEIDKEGRGVGISMETIEFGKTSGLLCSGGLVVETTAAKGKVH